MIHALGYYYTYEVLIQYIIEYLINVQRFPLVPKGTVYLPRRRVGVNVKHHSLDRTLKVNILLAQGSLLLVSNNTASS